MMSSPEARIRAEALALGFDVVRFADVTGLAAWPAAARLQAFLDEGRQGTMGWMEATAERRAHPQAMWPGARSAIVLGLNYGPAEDPRAALAHPERGVVSVYAKGDDYHELIKARLKRLGRWMARECGGELKVFVDTAPLMEKPLAEAAGLGWQGKHTNLVSRTHGSWLFLGAVLTSLDLAPDPPAEESCGSCRACLDACPTNAFPAPFQLDARRCLSYLTIEHAGPWPEAFRIATGNRIYGCDDCLAVCPWNKWAQSAREGALQAREALRAPALVDLLALDDAAFRVLFSKSPVKRIGRARFLRNVLYAAANSGEPALTAPVIPLLDDASPLVRGAAVWALRRLAPDTLSDQAGLAAAETDLQVRAEWAAATGGALAATQAGAH